MSKFVQVEVCNDGTITRACARALNRAIGTNLSGSDTVDVALECAEIAGVQVRVVQASALKGADKARHTREVTRSRNAQARREARKAAELVAA